MVKNLPAMWEIQVQFLGWEDPLEKGMATHSSILSLKILWTEESNGLWSMGSQRVRHNWLTNTFTFFLKSLEQVAYPWSTHLQEAPGLVTGSVQGTLGKQSLPRWLITGVKHKSRLQRCWKRLEWGKWNNIEVNNCKEWLPTQGLEGPG